MPPLFNKAVIVGVGQLGSSIGMNLVAQKLVGEVIGVGRSESNLRRAKRMHAIDRFCVGATGRSPVLDLDANDLIILATPVRTIRESLRSLPKGPLIIDVGSTKTAIVKEALKRKLRFIGCHPIAGTERGGAVSGDRQLFRGRIVIVTPGSATHPADLAQVRALWKKLGAKVVTMSPEEHDRVFAISSHLPHALAFALSRAAGRKLQVSRHKPFIFTSFRDATRVAASPVEMWRDILLENAPEVLKGLEVFSDEIQILRSALTSKNEKKLNHFLLQAQKMRQRLST